MENEKEIKTSTRAFQSIFAGNAPKRIIFKNARKQAIKSAVSKSPARFGRRAF